MDNIKVKYELWPTVWPEGATLSEVFGRMKSFDRYEDACAYQKENGGAGAFALGLSATFDLDEESSIRVFGEPFWPQPDRKVICVDRVYLNRWGWCEVEWQDGEDMIEVTDEDGKKTGLILADEATDITRTPLGQLLISHVITQGKAARERASLKDYILIELDDLAQCRKGNVDLTLKVMRAKNPNWELVGPYKDGRLDYLEAEGQIVSVYELCWLVDEMTNQVVTVDGEEKGDPNELFLSALRELESEKKIVWNKELRYVALPGADSATAGAA